MAFFIFSRLVDYQMSQLKLLLLLVNLLANSVYTQVKKDPVEEVIINLEGVYGSKSLSSNFNIKVEKAIRQSFLKKYPYIRLQHGSQRLWLEGVEGGASTLLAIAGGTAADLLEFEIWELGSYIQKGFLYPLDEWINTEITALEARTQGIFDENIMYRDELEARVHPQAIDALYSIGPDGKKHFYCLPKDTRVRVLAYNKILFREAGLDPAKEIPKTWDELWEVGKKITNPEENRYAFFGTGAYDIWASWEGSPLFLSMNTTRVIQDPHDGSWRAAFNGPGVTTAADFWIKLVSKEWTHPQTGKAIRGIGKYGASRGVWDQWDNDQVAMVFTHLNVGIMNEGLGLQGRSYDEVGIARIPTAPNGRSVSELRFMLNGITSTVKDPAVRDAVWKYIRYASGDEAERIKIEMNIASNNAKYIRPDLLKKYGYEEYISQVPQEWADAVYYSLKNCVPEPYGKNTQYIYQMMASPIVRAYGEDLAQHPDRQYRLDKLQEFYDEAVQKTNEKMMKIIPEDVRQLREIVSLVIASIIFVMFIFLFIYIWRVFTPDHLGASSNQSHFKKFRLAYILLVPAALIVLIFNYYPLLRGGLMAFQEYSVIHGAEFTGMTNFSLVFFDWDFWQSILVAFYYSALFILLVFIPPIFLAILLNEIPMGKVFFRVLYYLPAVVSGVVTMLLWKNFFNPTESGLMNQLLGVFGLEPIWWLGNKSTAMLAIMLPQAWAQLGPGCLIYLAALKTVPDEMYESAALDGCGFIDRIRYITLPMIKPLIRIQLIFALIAAFQATDTVLVMTGGGPDRATMVVGLEIFFNAFMFQRFGVATAMAWILGFILMGFTVFQMRKLSQLTFTTAK